MYSLYISKYPIYFLYDRVPELEIQQPTNWSTEYPHLS